MKDDGKHRRTFLKRAGAVGLVGGLTSLAGCTGGDGGGGGGDGGGGGGGDGGGGGGGDGGSTGGDGGSSKRVRIAAAPLGLLTFPWEQHVKSNGIFKDQMEAAGYPDYQVTWTWEEKVLGASGQADIIGTIGSIEGARIGPERDIQIAVNAAAMLTQYQGWIVEAGGPYDPAVAGGQQAAMDALVQDGGTVGIGSWAGGHIPPDQIIIQENWGYDFSEDGDFSVVTSDYATLGKLLEQGDIACAVTGPPLHAPQLMDGGFETAAIYWEPKELEKLGYLQTNLALANVLTTQQFAEEHDAATKAFMQSMHEGLTWMADQDPSNLELSDSAMQSLSAQTVEEARYILDWSYNFYQQPLTPPDFALTDEYIQADKQALQAAEEIGQVPSGWQDFVNYNKISLE